MYIYGFMTISSANIIFKKLLTSYLFINKGYKKYYYESGIPPLKYFPKIVYIFFIYFTNYIYFSQKQDEVGKVQ